MKKSFQFFVWVILVIAGLMVVLVITQINTSRSIMRLVQGNRQAAATLVVNNRLEELVNFSFELESKLLTEKAPYIFQNSPGIADSVSMLLQKAKQLEKIMQEEQLSSSLRKILAQVNNQTAISSAVITAAQKQPLLDSLKNKHFGDSIYSNALAFQMEMEQSLRATLSENNQVANKVFWLNRVLAITALVAILVLGTIIIRRQVIQFILIKDLEQARQLAEQSVQAKDQFLANMSHEIRTPLNALKGFSRLLSKTKLDKDQLQFTRIINSSSESLLNIVNDILDLSKMEAGAWSVKNKKFSLHALLKDLELTYTTLAKEKNLVFTLLLDGNVENNLSGDQQRLRQVLMNLISNAVKFTDEGSIVLSVSTTSKGANVTGILFAVSDTGIGIPADKQELIFERFEQLDNSFVRQQGGTGLGLSITRMILESLGGKIVVNSEPGKGSTFSFTLNFAIEGQPMVDGKTVIASADLPVTDITRKNILLAEDNKVNQFLIQKILAPFDIHPLLAENGQEVLKILETQEVDLILMDVQMPVMDGLTTTGVIRKQMKNNTPVIGMTAYVQQNEINKCFAAGMNDFLPKPIDEQQFLETIKKYVFLRQNLPAQETLPDATLPPEFSFLETICNGNRESMKLILNTMLEELPVSAVTIEEALVQKNVVGVQRAMHHLKSTLSPMGATTAVSQSLVEVYDLFMKDTDRNVLENAGNTFLSILKDYIRLLESKKLLF